MRPARRVENSTETGYRLYKGYAQLDWQHRPMLFHPSGCVLCCPVRVTNAGGGRRRHPANCSNCGPSWEHRRPDRCVHCHRTAHFRDDNGHPTHKACLENHILASLRTGTATETPNRTAA